MHLLLRCQVALNTMSVDVHHSKGSTTTIPKVSRSQAMPVTKHLQPCPFKLARARSAQKEPTSLARTCCPAGLQGKVQEASDDAPWHAVE